MSDLQPESRYQDPVSETSEVRLRMGKMPRSYPLRVPWLFVGYVAGIAVSPPVSFGWVLIGGIVTLAASPFANRHLRSV
jgi:hypothetical protein